MLHNLPCGVKTFDEVFPTEAACQQFWEAERWQQIGYFCPRCTSSRGWLLPKRGIMQCARKKCRYQVSSTAGTILHRTRLPLRTWLRAIVHYAEQPLLTVRGLASILGVSVKTAGLMLRKIRLAWQYYRDEFGHEPSIGERRAEQRRVQHQDQHQDRQDHEDNHDHHDNYDYHDQDNQDNHDLRDHQDEPGGFNVGQFMGRVKQYVMQRTQAVSRRFIDYVFTCTAAPSMHQIWKGQAEKRQEWREQVRWELEWREIEWV
ncbi:IS1595 family transposase [Paenibacillaceae bacterium]|nr:IS1595 family transposase [Paenibacillaceae bacterium]